MDNNLIINSLTTLEPQNQHHFILTKTTRLTKLPFYLLLHQSGATSSEVNFWSLFQKLYYIFEASFISYIYSYTWSFFQRIYTFISLKPSSTYLWNNWSLFCLIYFFINLELLPVKLYFWSLIQKQFYIFGAFLLALDCIHNVWNPNGDKHLSIPKCTIKMQIVRENSQNTTHEGPYQHSSL